MSSIIHKKLKTSNSTYIQSKQIIELRIFINKKIELQRHWIKLN